MKRGLFLLALPLTLFAKDVNLSDFEGLMGNKTAHWRHVKHPQDLAFLEKAKSLYLKNYKEQFSQNSLYKIPPVIHFIWLGPRPFPPESVENVRTWIAKHPDWEVKFWTDREREPPCFGMKTILVKEFYFSRLARCYEESQNWGEKSDLLRYEILFKEGGVYVDHDANCLQSFEGLHKGFDFFCCLEPPHEPFVGRNITCGNAVIGSRPRHPTIDKVIDLVAKRWDKIGRVYRGQDEYSKSEVVMQRTYIAFSDAVLKTINEKGNVDIILPAAYLFSKTGIPSLYSQHFYVITWDESRVKTTPFDKEAGRVLNQIQKKNSNLRTVLIGLIGLNLLSGCLFLFKLRKS